MEVVRVRGGAGSLRVLSSSGPPTRSRLVDGRPGGSLARGRRPHARVRDDGEEVAGERRGSSAGRVWAVGPQQVMSPYPVGEASAAGRVWAVGPALVMSPGPVALCSGRVSADAPASPCSPTSSSRSWQACLRASTPGCAWVVSGCARVVRSFGGSSSTAGGRWSHRRAPRSAAGCSAPPRPAASAFLAAVVVLEEAGGSGGVVCGVIWWWPARAAAAGSPRASASRWSFVQGWRGAGRVMRDPWEVCPARADAACSQLGSRRGRLSDGGLQFVSQVAEEEVRMRGSGWRPAHRRRRTSGARPPGAAAGRGANVYAARLAEA